MKNVFINILTITGGITLFSLIYKFIQNIFRDKLDTARIEGWNDGYHEGAEDGSNYVYNKVEKIDPETQKILKEELIKDGCKFYD